jgi:hypothetical protein
LEEQGQHFVDVDDDEGPISRNLGRSAHGKSRLRC